MDDGIRIEEGEQLAVEDCRRLVLASEPWVTLGYGTGEADGIARSSVSDNVLVALAGTDVVGFALSTPGVLLGEYLKLLVVEPAYRKRGVGRRLMEELERRAFLNAPNVYLCVSDFNRDARAFYARLGYEEVGLLRDLLLAGKGEVLMRKSVGCARSFGANRS